MPYVQNVDDDWMASTLWLGDVSMRQHATLTLKIRMRLNLMPATALEWRDFNGVRNVTQTIDWDDGRAERWFKSRMKQYVEEAWSGRFWLVPDRDWAGPFASHGIQGRERYAPAISLRLVLDFNFGARHPHAVVNTYRLPRTEEGRPHGYSRSSMHAPYSLTGQARQCSWEENTSRGTLDTGDVLPKPNGQIPVVHEMGHYIGLNHVNAAGARQQGLSTNDSIAYGVGDQQNDYMGMGTRFAPWHAYPWCQRLRRHLTQANLRFESGRWASRSPIQWRTASGIGEFRRGALVQSDPVTWTVTMERPRPRMTHASDPLVMPG